jgi:hypothetical protein
MRTAATLRQSNSSLFRGLILFARNKKAYTIEETSLLPAAMKMCGIIQGEKYGEALKTSPLSYYTLLRRIGSMSEGIKK